MHDCNVGKTSFPREGIELPYLVQLGGSNDDVSSARCSRSYEFDIHSQKRAVRPRVIQCCVQVVQVVLEFDV